MRPIYILKMADNENILTRLGKLFQSNIIIRKRGYRTLRRRDRGMPWRKYLKVGEPPVV